MEIAIKVENANTLWSSTFAPRNTANVSMEMFGMKDILVYFLSGDICNSQVVETTKCLSILE